MIDLNPGGGSSGDGPSDDVLQRLSGMMTSAMKGMAGGRIGGKGRPARKTQPPPMSACKICSEAFPTPAGEQSAVTYCVRCAKMLKDGFIAIVSSEKFAFVKSPRFTPGEVIAVSEAIMTRVETEFKAMAQAKQKPKQPKKDANT